MNGLRVIEPGLTSVQDAGRFGAQRYGVSPAGVMDRFSLAMVNALLRRPALAAALEIGPFPVKLVVVGGPLRLAVTGTQRKVRVAATEVQSGTTFLASEGAEVCFDAARTGMFSYLAAEGGIIASAQLGSLAVDVRAEFGSPYPRPLRNGDFIEFHRAGSTSGECHLAVEPPSTTAPIRVVMGPQDDYFHRETIARFLSSRWIVAANSNRMSYRLDGEPLAHSKGYNIVSDGIVMGHIQVAGNGQPLVMLADRGTTGGYPKIATIITADLGRFAQTPIGAAVRFKAVSVAEAQSAARQLHRAVQELPGTVRPLRNFRFDPEFLLQLNLAGDAVDALLDTADSDDRERV